MKIVVLNGSPRKNGNTEVMADYFINSAAKAGHECEKFNVASMNIAPCLGCRACLETGGICVQKDDMGEVIAALDACDMLVLASPCYHFNISAQLSTAISRTYVYMRKPYHFKKAALLMQGGAPDYEAFVAPIVHYNILCKCNGWQDTGIITINRVPGKGAIADKPELAQIDNLISRLG